MAQNVSTTTRQSSDQRLTRPSRFSSPFEMLERLAGEMDRMFDDFGLPGALRPRGMPLSSSWSPRIDMTQRGNELDASPPDLPGSNKDDVKVDVTEDAITIQGERHREHEEEKGGLFRKASAATAKL